MLRLASEFGLSIPIAAGGQPQSPEFYADLITSRSILGPIVDDTISVIEEGGQRRTVLELLDVKAPASATREEGVRKLRRSIQASIARPTGVVKVAVSTEWPSVSLAVTERLVEGVNRFNLQSRQSQAREERRFVEGRVGLARESLVEAEEQLGAFLRANRQFRNSPDLTFEFERRQREVALKQQVLVGLAQSYEEARMREVRDVPVITVIEAPTLPVRADSRGRALRGLLGLLLGGFVGIVSAFASDSMSRRRAQEHSEVARFTGLLRDLRRDVTRWVPGRRRQEAEARRDASGLDPTAQSEYGQPPQASTAEKPGQIA